MFKKITIVNNILLKTNYKYENNTTFKKIINKTIFFIICTYLFSNN